MQDRFQIVFINVVLKSFVGIDPGLFRCKQSSKLIGSKHKRKIGINVLNDALSIDFDDAAEYKKADFGTFKVYFFKFSLLKTSKQ